LEKPEVNMMRPQAFRYVLVLCVLSFAFVQHVWPAEQVKPVAEAELRTASAKAIKLIQHSQVVWYQKQTCTSCHHQLLPEIPLNLARERGVSFDEKIARDSTATAFAYLKDLDAAVQGYDYIDVLFDGWALTTAHAAGIRPSFSTAAYAQFIASRQLADGSWPTIDARPPQAHSPFAVTAVCAQAIRHYLPARLRDEQATRLWRTREWLLKAQPHTTEDRAFQFFGLRWTDADEEERRKAGRALLAEQREDGGWAQLAGLASDAYSTGEALVALREGVGLPINDPAYQRGLRFLLKTQQSDGSWRITSRLHPPAPVSPPYVDTEFPDQHDQFISIMGTSWAVTAMVHALPAPAEEKLKRPVPDFAPAEQTDQARWIPVALSGSATELKKLLDEGMSPDAKTTAGTTALMLAASDPEKVKLLLERGADVNARAATGITPLMVAARYRGNVEVVRLLLQKGAKPKVDKGIEVRNDASALFFAVMARDVPMAGALLNAGAKLEDKMKILGNLVTSPMAYATFGGDSAMVEFLTGWGANPNEVDTDSVSVLAWATIGNHLGTVQALLARGAQVNYVDSLGMTPLLYAASINFGDTAVVEKLIASGADLKAKNKEGLTAPDLAKKYNHTAIATLLATAPAPRPESVQPELVNFPTEDGGVVYANLYGKGERGVVLAHGGRFNKESWEKQAQVLVKAGFRVLAIDFRGRGQSKGGPQAKPDDDGVRFDVLAAVRYLRKAGAKSVSVVGGSFGGGAAADAAVEAAPGEIDRLVLLASGADRPEQVKGRKLFIICRDDPQGNGTPRLVKIREQYEKTPGPKELVILDCSAHAQFIFSTDQEERLMREILRFLSAP
jgi:ankyrin repeat protein/alpha/beta superfamily hydrolase